MRKTELIVALNSLQWDIETKGIKSKDIDYYSEVINEVQTILLDIDE
jgi:hypothetical protein